MKSLNENKTLASMKVARTNIDQVIIKVGNNFAHLNRSLFKGNNYEFLLTKKKTKVLVYDNKGKKVDEIEIAPPKPKTSKTNKKDQGADKDSKDSKV